MWGHGEETTIYKLMCQPSSDTKSASCLDLGLLSLYNSMRNKCLLFIRHTFHIFLLQQSEWSQVILEDTDEAELVVGEILQKAIMSPKELDMIEWLTPSVSKEKYELFRLEMGCMCPRLLWGKGSVCKTAWWRKLANLILCQSTFHNKLTWFTSLSCLVPISPDWCWF